VAVKILRSQFADDEEFVERFRREARSAASLSHPNIVNIYDVGETDRVHFIVMEYVQGNNLHDLIRDHGALFPGRCNRAWESKLPWVWPMPITTELFIAILSPTIFW
jgi:serine/threonine protein kinase